MADAWTDLRWHQKGSQRKSLHRNKNGKIQEGRGDLWGQIAPALGGPEQMKQKPPAVLEHYLRVISDQSTVVTIQDVLNLMTQRL